MAFTYQSYTQSGLSLKERYQVKHHSGSRQLIPGMLVQGRRPAHAGWLGINDAHYPLPQRYFVKTGSPGRLVPGGLITSNKHPGGPWRELKKLGPPYFHQIIFDTHYTVNSQLVTAIITHISTFHAQRLMPVVQTVFPDRNYAANPFDYRFYYYRGDFITLNRDATKLIPSGMTASIRANDAEGGNLFPEIISSGTAQNITLQATPAAPEGTYSLVAGILNTPGDVSDFVVMENVLVVSFEGD